MHTEKPQDTKYGILGERVLGERVAFVFFVILMLETLSCFGILEFIYFYFQMKANSSGRKNSYTGITESKFGIIMAIYIS